jgi:uncharacterized repeat protein (TIGR03803 family)
LHNFAALSVPYSGTNSDGAAPFDSLVLSGNSLYGTVSQGGAGGYGTVFRVNTNGTGFTNLHSFTKTSGPYPGTNQDGAFPVAGLLLSENILYGTANNGGNSGNGTAHKVNSEGSSFTVLYSFTGLNSLTGTNRDGANPAAGFTFAGNNLFGTAYAGGNSGRGTLFSLILWPQLTIISSGTNVILRWPTNVSGFILQSAPTSVGTITYIDKATNPFTNPVTGAQQFFRLSQ